MLADSLPAEQHGNMPRNEEMLSFPLLFSQGKAIQEYACVFCDVLLLMVFIDFFFEFYYM